jgi:Tol biopolymer transport system component
MRGLAWTPPGQIVYRSVASGEPNVWIMQADGSGQAQLSFNTSQNFDPTVSPDGLHIAWGSRRTASTNIWEMNLDGSNPRQITNGVGEYFPEYSPDGKWILYTAYDASSGFWSVWKVPVEGGTPQRLTDKESAISVVSPDGKFFACNYQDQPGGAYKIAIIPLAGGPPKQILEIFGSFGRPIRWTPDGKGIAFVTTLGDVSNLGVQELSGGNPTKLTNFRDQRIFSFAWSRDGKQLALSRGVVNSDVVLLKGFGP